MPWLAMLKYWKLGLIGILLAGYIPYGWFKHHQGREEEFKVCELAKFEAFQHGSETRKAIDIKVKRLSVSDVDAALSAGGWMRQDD